MVTLSQFDDTVFSIKRSFYHLIKHPYFDLYLADPPVDEDKIRFMFAMLEGDDIPNKDVELYTIASLLVQAALDIHESIPLHNESASYERRKGQLEILAGDYYSSLYYYLLAKHNKMSMIQVFSNTIQEINESKMLIYKNDNTPSEKIEENTVFIESILIRKIASHFGRDEWNEIMKDFFYLKRLLLERKEWTFGKTNTIIHLLQEEIQNKDDLISFLDEKINTLKERIIEKSKVMNRFEQFITELVDDLFVRFAPKEKIVGER